MKKQNAYILTIFISLSFIIKLILIFKYKNQLTLASDDLNYIKSAVVLAKNGTFIFHSFTEPTVYVMPLYPFFLAVVFKLAGYGLAGLQAVRIIQALFSCITILMVYLTARHLFNEKTALVSSFLVSFYIPNIVSAGYILTETLFTTLLLTLIYLSLKFAQKPTGAKFALLGLLWVLAVLCRPTIALYPVLLFIYLFIYFKYGLLKLIRLGLSMLIPFLIIMAPWWVRNYQEYDTFIPLAASSGNPMLQGTYINYEQNPGNVTYYKLGKTTFETNKNEVETAKRRIVNGFKEDPWGYLKWYTLGKTKYFWGTVFYWRKYFSISHYFVYIYHCILLLGFFGLMMNFRSLSRYMLPVLVILYFNVVHCVYMAFDRYAFPVMPILSIFCAFFIIHTRELLLKSVRYTSA